MHNSPLAFYDDLASYYHLIFDDWDAAIERQARVLEPLLTSRLPPRQLEILDCACGIGTQALGFAARGHRVTGSDLSGAAIVRARREAEARALPIDFHVADMTTLTGVPQRTFDVVAALDNALPHLMPDQMASALSAIRSRLKPGGLFVASLRDYDRLAQARPAMQPPAFFGEPGGRRIVHQVWDWHRDDAYTVHLYLTLEDEGQWEAHHFVSEYRCLLRTELTAALHAAGFPQVEWLTAEASGYYQPLVLAR